jgi:diguanylate cyclase (GGDEF)-like protein/PAS domain S-box-containing protein
MNIYVFVFILFIVATVTLTLALRSLQRGVNGAQYFSLLLVSLSIGAFSYAMELWGMQESFKFVWLIFKQICVVFSPVFWLIFVLQYTDKSQWLQRPYLLSFTIIPALTTVLLITTRIHGLMFSNIQLQNAFILDFEYGPYYWVHVVYTYLLFGLGLVLIFQWLRQNQLLRFWQTVGLIAGALLLVPANIITILGFPSNIPFDLTIIGTALGVLLTGWAMFGLNFFGANPIAREALIESMKDGVIVIDTKRVVTDINPAAIRLIHVNRSPIGQNVQTLIPETILLPTLDVADTYPHQEISLQGSNGVIRNVDLRASPLPDGSRILRGWLLLLRDISEEKRLQNELKKQSLRHAALAEIELAINQPHELVGVLKKIVARTIELLPASGGATIFIWNDETHTFEYVESSLPSEDLSGQIKNAKQGRGSAPWIVKQRQIKVVTDINEEPFNDREVLEKRGICAYVGLPLISNDKVVGVLYANDKHPRIYNDDDLQFLQTLAYRAANAISRVQQFSLVQQQATTDHVTGIHNRRQFFNLGDLEFRRARRFNRPLSAIMLDIDHFKKVNDQYGHATGDRVLNALAQFMKIHLREFDVLGRYGGEEFAIILPGADLNSARNVAYRLRQAVQDHTMVNGSVTVTISLGVAQLSEDTLDFQSLINKADMAMYDAKRAGRNRVAWGD